MSGPRSYGRGAAVLSVGIGVTGLVTYTYFSLASHSLADDEYGRISLLWSAVFIVVSVLYRPVEQLLSRTIAEQSAHAHVLRVAATIQAGLGIAFVVAALALREPIEDGLFDGSETLYWIFVGTVVAYAASYFARGYLAGHHRFGAYGLLVLLEATSRCLFAVAVAVGIAEGQDAVAFGMVAAPIVSLDRGAVRARARAPFAGSAGGAASRGAGVHARARDRVRGGGAARDARASRRSSTRGR